MITLGNREQTLYLGSKGVDKAYLGTSLVYEDYVWDLDALSFISAAAITDEAIKKAIDYLCKNWKKEGFWNRIVAAYPFVGGTAYSSKYNLKNTNQYTLNWGGTEMFSQKGLTPNGSSPLLGLNTSGIPEVNDNFHASFYVQNNISTDATDIGTTDYNLKPNRLAVILRYVIPTNPLFFDFGDLSTNFENCRLIVDSYQASSCIVVNKTRGNISAWRNGEMKGIHPNPGGVPDSPLAINSERRYNTRIYSMITIGEGLDDSEQKKFNDIMQAFQSMLGRAV